MNEDYNASRLLPLHWLGERLLNEKVYFSVTAVTKKQHQMF